VSGLAESGGATFDELRDLYQEVILDHGRKPRHAKRLDTFDARAKGDNPMCGDRVEVFLRREGAAIGAVGFEARGCAISIASADLMAEAVAGSRAEDARKQFAAFEAMARTGRTEDALVRSLWPLAGVSQYPSRLKCATLPWHALLAALDGEGQASSE
jgi:nitrogen fixation NifU-like protein